MPIIVAPLTFEERQQKIDATLTEKVVAGIVAECGQSIMTELMKNKSSRHVTIIFASTDALLRRINNENEKIIGMLWNTLELERVQQPKSKVLADCDGKVSFCVTIATNLPFTMLGVGKDSLLTHTMTCLKIPTV